MSVGNLSVTLTANVAEFMKNMGSAADIATASAERMVKENRQVAQSVAGMQAEGRRFLATLQEEANTYGKTRDELLKYRAAQLGVAEQAKGIIAKLKEMGATDGVRGAKEEMEKLNFATAGARRELLVLAHEASQGNWKRFAGSMMVLGERTDAMSLLFSRTGMAIGLAAGAAVAFAVAAAKGAQESIVFRDSMKVTGDYAGITAGQFDHMAKTVAASSKESIGNSREALQALVSTGRFSGQTLADAAQATVKLERYTGQSSEEIVKDFARMKEGVAKWVEEHNQSMHFATLAQYQHIKALEDAGQKEQAAAEAFKLLNQQLKDDETRLGFLERSWRGVKNAISEAVDAAKDFGKNDPALKRDKRIDDLQNELNARVGRGGVLAVTGRERERDQRLLNTLLAEKAADEARQKAKAENDATQEKGIAAVKRLNDHWREMAGSINLANKEIALFRADMEAALKANPNDKDALDAKANQAKIEAAIRKKYDKVDVRADNAFQDKLRALQDEGIKLDGAIAQWEKYGKAMDKSRAAVLDWDLAHDRVMKNFSADKKAQLMAQAQADDAKAEKLAGIEAVKSIEEEIKTIEAEAKVQGIAKEATLQARLQKKLDSEQARISADEYARLSAWIKEATGALEAKHAVDAIHMMEGKTGDEIKRIREEAELVGKSTLERQKLAEALRIEAWRREQLEKFPLDAAKINASAARQVADVSAALDAAYAKMTSFNDGATAAFKDYAENAANAARASHQVFTTAFKGMEDALVKWAETGKLHTRSLMTSIREEMLRTGVQKNITGPMAQMLWGASDRSAKGMAQGNASAGLFASVKDWMSGLFGGANQSQVTGALKQADSTGFIKGVENWFSDLFGSNSTSMASLFSNIDGSGLMQGLESWLSDLFKSESTSSSGSGFFSGIGSSVSSLFASANGNAFINGAPIRAFADGGAFTNSIVSSPTAFPMGLMGEAGPEAIMPLTRDASGKLGVRGAVSGGGDVNLSMPINIDARGADAGVEARIYAAVVPMIQKVQQSVVPQVRQAMARKGLAAAF